MSKGTIYIDQERCKGCALCVPICPQVVLALEPKTLNGKGYHPAVLLDPLGKCTGCGICAIMCPDVAITVYREAILPAAQRASLR